MAYEGPWSYRPAIMGRRGAVASNLPLATQEATYPHDAPDALNPERRFPPEVREDLAARGHRVVALGDLDRPCSVEIIRRDPATGMLMAGSDPRRDGWALAY